MIKILNIMINILNFIIWNKQRNNIKIVDSLGYFKSNLYENSIDV